MEHLPDMNANSQAARDANPALTEAVFVSPDRAMAQRVITRLRTVCRVNWQPSFAPGSAAPVARLNVVLLDFSPSHIDESTQLKREFELLSPTTAVLAVGSTQTDGSAGVLAAMRTGISDFIDLDAPDTAEAAATIDRATRQAATARPPHLVDQAPKDHGRTVLLLGVRPGVGTSTLVAHLGVMLQQLLGQGSDEKASRESRIIALDMGLPGGDLGLYLNTQGDFQIDDAIDNAYRLDTTLARTALARHESNLTVLPRASDTDVPTDASGHLDLLLDRLDDLFGLVLIDAGGMSSDNLSALLANQAHEIWLIVDQGLGSMVSLDNMLKSLKRSGAERDKLALVVNRYMPESGLEPAQIAERFKLPLLATLPDRGAHLRTAANTGKLLCDTAPRDRYLQAFKPLLKRLFPDADSTDKSRSSWLQSVRGRLGV